MLLIYNFSRSLTQSLNQVAPSLTISQYSLFDSSYCTQSDVTPQHLSRISFPKNPASYSSLFYPRTSTFALGACVGPSIAGVLVDNFKFGWASLFVVVTELSVFVITFAFLGYR